MEQIRPSDMNSHRTVWCRGHNLTKGHKHVRPFYSYPVINQAHKTPFDAGTMVGRHTTCVIQHLLRTRTFSARFPSLDSPCFLSSGLQTSRLIGSFRLFETTWYWKRLHMLCRPFSWTKSARSAHLPWHVMIKVMGSFFYRQVFINAYIIELVKNIGLIVHTVYPKLAFVW